MKEYLLKNMDCAECAINIEEKIKNVEGVHEARVNFATSKLWLDSEDPQETIKLIKKIEPEVIVEEISSTVPRKPEIKRNFSKILLSIIVPSLLLIVGIIFKGQIHRIFFGSGEWVLFGSAYLLSGWMVLKSAFKNIIHGKLFDESFLMSVATLGALFIHALPEAVGVMLFYRIGEYFQDIAVERSRASITSLLALRPQFARVNRAGSYEKVSPDRVGVGETIIVKPGEKIPLDGVVTEGESEVDTSALTGEPVPKIVRMGEKVFAGTISITGTLLIRVTKPLQESSISKILTLVERASERKAKSERFITRFSRYYSPAVVGIAAAIALVPPIFIEGALFSDWLYRALIMLVISCPCALVISIPLGYFGGIGRASKRGILVKGANFLDILTKVTSIVFDKTGTLTKGVFRVVDIEPAKDFSRDELLKWAASAEAPSHHPIARSIVARYGKKLHAVDISRFTQRGGLGIGAIVEGKEVLCGNDRMLHTEGIPHDRCDINGTVIHVVVDKKYAGYIVIADELKDGAKAAIGELKKLGIQNIGLLTGDSNDEAERIAKELKLDFYFADLMPEDKVERLEYLMGKSGDTRVSFIGDGINDAPVITRADVGIAMGAFGSEAAIETADVVIMDDSLEKIPEALQIARKTKRIVWQNIFLALLVKGVFLLLGAFGLATMWEAVFGDVGISLLAIFNALRILR